MGPRQELGEITSGGDHLSHPPGIQLHIRCGKITKDTWVQLIVSFHRSLASSHMTYN